ncbi:MAG: AMP-binding protein, partial [Alphaproteobacteria bacterium]|nr:AMP-binding protein [Alphaproteobacteria bacterium]
AVPSDAATDAPRDARTLTEVLDHFALRHPDHPHIRLYADADGGEVLTHALLRDAARAMAGALAGLGVGAGDAVALMLPTGRDYFVSFFAILYAGGIPAPLYPPARLSQIGDHIQRQVKTLDNCRAKILIAMAEAAPVAGLLKGSVTSLDHVVTPAELESDAPPPPLPRLKGCDVAFLQYTSGSTGQPKGVTLSHANLLANIRALGRAMSVGPGDVFVSWLPLYHDMGLIGGWLGSLYHGVPLVILTPLQFLARPQRWLDAMTRFGGTVTAAPNFAYDLCVKRVPDEALADLDLAKVRYALNGAEPVIPATLERFARRFAACGFRAEALKPAYGLAECSVGLALTPVDRGPRVDRVVRAVFSATGEARPAPADDAMALVFASSGRALPGHDIRVVDGAGHVLPERVEGDVQFRGPSATSGYWRNEPETRKLIRADGWLVSGDRGYMADGEIFITGRAKDMVIRAGRNIYPAELEDAVGELDGIRKGAVAVFAATDADGGAERLVVMAETRKAGEEARRRLTRAIEDLCLDLTATPPDEVVLVPPNTVPKTSSGKIRRAACREILEGGHAGEPRPAPWLQIARLALGTARPTLTRAMRVASSTLYAAWAWGVAAIAVAMLTILFPLAPGMRARWALVRGVVRAGMAATAMPVTTTGRENLGPEERDIIYIANHQSYLDGFVAAMALGRPVRFVAKGELRDSALLHYVLTRLGVEFVERFDAGASIGDALRLAEGTAGRAPLFYFPEGTFIDRPGLLAFRMGAFAAAAAGVCVQPLVIRGTRRILPGDARFPRRGRITVEIGPAFAPGADLDDDWARAVDLRDRTRAWVLERCGEPDMAHEQAAIFSKTDGPP